MLYNMACSCSKNTLLLGTATLISTSLALWSTYKLLKSKLICCFHKEIPTRVCNELLIFHYGRENEICPLPWMPKEALTFHRRCAELVSTFRKLSGSNQALDLGCSVGRASFELARYFQKVIGIDRDHTCLAVSQQLKKFGQLVYNAVEEGDHLSAHIAEVDSSIDRSRVEFICEDVRSPAMIGAKFDCILLANFLCELDNPLDFLSEIHSILNPEGILVIVSSYLWRNEIQKQTLGTHKDADGNVISTFDILQEELRPNFELLKQTDIPLVGRKSRRQFHMIITHATVWRKKNQKPEDE